MIYRRPPDPEFEKFFRTTTRIARIFLFLGVILTALNAQRPV
jgi:hypothetical protein